MSLNIECNGKKQVPYDHGNIGNDPIFIYQFPRSYLICKNIYKERPREAKDDSQHDPERWLCINKQARRIVHLLEKVKKGKYKDQYRFNANRYRVQLEVLGRYKLDIVIVADQAHGKYNSDQNDQLL